ncbi:MAG: lipid-A-disaccharide synthase [Bacteroidetes bacterium]|nr:lipid-A-disaccharide synthase [Bacteroidota bacterium]
MRYYFIAGEVSGDIHAANCMKEILKLDNDAKFAFTGGDLMQQVSGEQPTVHIRDMAFMGFVDVLKNIRTIQKNFKKVKADILNFKPDLLILVDYPGFNLRMAKWAWEHNIKVDYYISPTVWAWKEGRVEQIKKYTHKLFVILPFEEAFYQKHHHKVYFVGHPLIDAIEQKKPLLKSKQEFIKENNLSEKPIVAVLPGSRKQEMDYMLGNMVEVISQFPNYQFVIAGSTNLPKSYYKNLEEKNINVLFNQTYELMSYAEAGIIKSGTSTLESALFKLPQVICYKGGALSFAIAKRIVDVKYIGLPNLIMDKAVVKELVQTDFTVKNITEELNKLLNDTVYKNTMLQEYDVLKQRLGGAGASARIAKHLTEDAGIKN